MEGKFRNHKIKLDETQTALKNYFMDYDITTFLTLKLPHSYTTSLNRTTNQAEAFDKYRTLIREIHKAYVGSNRWKKEPAFDFFLTLEHGTKNIHHCHLGLIPMRDTEDNEVFINKLIEACNTVLAKYALPSSVIDVKPVTDKEGVILYMLKEMNQKSQLNKNKTNLSMYYTLYSSFHIKGITYKED